MATLETSIAFAENGITEGKNYIRATVDIHAQWGGAVYAEVRAERDGVEAASGVSSTVTMKANEDKSVSVTIRGLSPSTTYTLYAILCLEDGTHQGAVDYTSATTLEDLPSFSVGEVTGTSATIHVTHGTGYNAFRIYVRNEDSSFVFDEKTVQTGNFTYPVTGLELGTKYYARVGYWTSTETTTWNWCGLDDFTTTKSVENWSWDKSNGSASAEETKKAEHAVKNRGPVSDFSYKVWNDMVNKAATVIKLRGQTWIDDDVSMDLASTLMTETDREMTAARFNSLRWNLGHYVATNTPSTVSGETPIMGEYFISLAQAINDTIAQGNLNG